MTSSNRSGQSNETLPSTILEGTGSTFYAVCKLHVMAQQIMSALYSIDGKPVVPRVPLDMVESWYSELLAWMDKLSLDLHRTSRCSYQILTLQ